MNRRSFLSSCLALAAAPAIVRADSLMRIVPRDVEVLTASSQDFVIDMEWLDGVTYEAGQIAQMASFTELVTRTLREHSAEIRASIEGHNALLKNMQRRRTMA